MDVRRSIHRYQWICHAGSGMTVFVPAAGADDRPRRATRVVAPTPALLRSSVAASAGVAQW